MLDRISSKISSDYLFGCDMSERAISFAKLLNPTLFFYSGDFKEIQGKFKVLTCIETLEHISDDDLQEFVRGLADKIEDNGYLIISVPTIAVPVHPKHYRHYDKNLLIDEIIKYTDLRVKEVYFMNKKIPKIEKYFNHSPIRLTFIDKICVKYYEKYCVFGKDEKECLRLLMVFEK